MPSSAEMLEATASLDRIENKMSGNGDKGP